MSLALAALLALLTAPFLLHISTAEDLTGRAPLVLLPGPDRVANVVASSSIFDDAAPIEAFLTAVDGEPPDWPAIYGTDGTGHDERLFALNRERDERRRANERLDQRMTFFWLGGYPESTATGSVSPSAQRPSRLAGAWFGSSRRIFRAICGRFPTQNSANGCAPPSAKDGQWKFRSP